MAVLMYTSGSTGKPKGVVITHAQCTAGVTGVGALGIQPGDAALGYLPLAHILELMSELCMIHYGCPIGYADPKSLTTKGAYPTGAQEEFQPTVMAGVPKVYQHRLSIHQLQLHLFSLQRQLRHRFL